jgi:flagellar biosynthesis anti-sigma factor FlgM
MQIPEKGALPPLPGGDPLADDRPERSVKVSTVLETDGRDTVSLTESGREFKAAVDRARSLPDIRLERVQLLRQQLEKGTYRVEANRIAVGMIDETIENNNALKHIDTKV